MLDRAIAAAEDVIIEIGSLGFIDSTGLAVLVQAAHGLRARGKRLVVVGGRRQVRRVLEVTGLAQAKLDDAPLVVGHLDEARAILDRY
jgi:anti-anti-sigma factor